MAYSYSCTHNNITCVSLRLSLPAHGVLRGLKALLDPLAEEVVPCEAVAPV